MHPENLADGLLIVYPPALTHPLFPTPPDLKKPLVVLFDPTPGREQTARRLAEVGSWRVMAIDSNRSSMVGPTIGAITSAAYGGDPASYKAAAFVLEAVHPNQPPFPEDDPHSARTAFQLIEWLTRFVRFEGVPFVLYTADRETLAQARREYATSRRDRYHRLHRFDGTIERDVAAESDLALAQLLDQLLIAPSDKG